MADFKVTELDPGTDFNNLQYWDVVIIGAGPGGLAASLTTAHCGLTTLVIEAKSEPGGQPQFLYADKKIVDIPGFPGMNSLNGHFDRRRMLWFSFGSMKNWLRFRTQRSSVMTNLSRRSSHRTQSTCAAK